MKHTATIRNEMFENDVDIEMEKSPSDWSASDVSHFFSKLEFPIQAMGRVASPKQISELPNSKYATFTVTSLDGKTTARVMVEGVPQLAISEWRKNYANSPKLP